MRYPMAPLPFFESGDLISWTDSITIKGTQVLFNRIHRKNGNWDYKEGALTF